MSKMDRRDFLKNTSLIAGGLTLAGCGTLGGLTVPKRNMCGFGAKPLSKVRVGFVGIGARGIGAVARLAKIQDVEIVAICDLKDDALKKAQNVIKRNGRPAAKEFTGDDYAWKKMCDLDLDLVYNCTPWTWHTPISVYAMEHGKHAAVEVPAAITVEESWQLVETSERTGKHCMMLENTCYDFFELMTLNMVRQGVFGELTHAEGAYIHELCGIMEYWKKWRLKQNQDKNGNLYPTHGLGPVAQCMNINRGNQFDYMVSISSKEAAFSDWAKRAKKDQYVGQKFRGDMNTSIIKCKKGETIMIQHDISTPRPYSRIHMLQGTRGCARKWPDSRTIHKTLFGKIALQNVDNGHRWLNTDEMRKIQTKYGHPLVNTIGELAKKVGGHGGMDFMMDYRLIYCLKHGMPLDQDVYDAAAWSVLFPLSQESVGKRGASLDMPDFTRGKWKTNTPLGIVDVDPSKLPIGTIRKDGAKQLNVH